jgi:hypothetical protein
MLIGFLFWQVGGKIFLSVEAFNFCQGAEKQRVIEPRSR